MLPHTKSLWHFLYEVRKMRTIENKEIRTDIKSCGACMWEVADLIGISPNSLSMWLRKPLEGERRERVLAAIEQFKAANKGKA